MTVDRGCGRISSWASDKRRGSGSGGVWYPSGVSCWSVLDPFWHELGPSWLESGRDFGSSIPFGWFGSCPARGPLRYGFLTSVIPLSGP